MEQSATLEGGVSATIYILEKKIIGTIPLRVEIQLLLQVKEGRD